MPATLRTKNDRDEPAVQTTQTRPEEGSGDCNGWTPLTKQERGQGSDASLGKCSLDFLLHIGAIPALVEALEGVRRPRYLTFEEGTMADWLYRNLRGHVDRLVVCEPRRNRLIAQEGEKDDPLDAANLAQLYRGGYLKAVHHAESEGRAILKQHVSLYHDRVRQRVREANRILAHLRSHGVVVQEGAFAHAEDRPRLLGRLPSDPLLQSDFALLWQSYDVLCAQEASLEKSLERLGRQHEPVRRFVELPGLSWIRATTFYVYVDTPWRFSSKEALWKYLGIGLARWHSGEGPGRVYVVRQANKRLKWVILGAAVTAIRGMDNPFAAQYFRWLEEAISVPNARRNVARSLAATLWGMWKNGSPYHPAWVGGGRAVGVA